MITADTSEAHALAVDLDRAATSAIGLTGIVAATEIAARAVKDDYTAQASASTHFRGMAGSFSYDRHHRLGAVEFEVGPDKSRRGGALGNIFFFGAPNGGGGTGDLDAPLDAAGADMERALSQALDGLL